MMLELQATPQEVMRAVEALQDFARAHGVPEKARFGLALALEECGSNIVDHALQRDPGRSFRVIIERNADGLVVELQDAGPAFDPTAARERLEQSDDDLPGGWGIQLARRYIDEIHYRREGDANILRLTKRLKPIMEAT